jgi:hypothetical protein
MYLASTSSKILRMRAVKTQANTQESTALVVLGSGKPLGHQPRWLTFFQNAVLNGNNVHIAE